MEKIKYFGGGSSFERIVHQTTSKDVEFGERRVGGLAPLNLVCCRNTAQLTEVELIGKLNAVNESEVRHHCLEVVGRHRNGACLAFSPLFLQGRFEELRVAHDPVCMNGQSGSLGSDDERHSISFIEMQSGAC